MPSLPATILLVEDDPLLRDAFRMLLEDAGYRILEAASVAEAMASIEAERPALVLLDLGLPDGSGLDVARRLREQRETRAIPVVAMTGRVGPEEREACLEAGCIEYLPKPVEPLLLLERLPGFLGRSD